ncbi:MAG TPA: hypothetical protein VGN00_09980 [Puia sp.]
MDLIPASSYPSQPTLTLLPLATRTLTLLPLATRTLTVHPAPAVGTLDLSHNPTFRRA